MATGTITVINPNKRTGQFKIISIDSSKDVCGPECIGTEINFVDPHGDSGASLNLVMVSKIVEAGASGIYIAIELAPKA